DPLEAKRVGVRAARTASERAKTFKWCALEFIKQHEKEWRGDASRRQWIGSLEQHAFPPIGDKPISDIDAAAVLSVLDPIRDRLVTARRVRTAWRLFSIGPLSAICASATIPPNGTCSPNIDNTKSSIFPPC